MLVSGDPFAHVVALLAGEVRPPAAWNGPTRRHILFGPGHVPDAEENAPQARLTRPSAYAAEHRAAFARWLQAQAGDEAGG
jgi:hypothetical protein